MTSYAYVPARLVKHVRRPGSPVAVLVYEALTTNFFASLPGHFCMLWVPGYEAIPLSIAYQDGARYYFIVKKRGPTTSKLVEDPPRYVGLIGPAGSPIPIPSSGEKILLLGGGVGVAPLIYFAAMIANYIENVTLVYGVRNPNELIRLDEIFNINRFEKVEFLIVAEETYESAVFKGTLIDFVRAKIGNKLREYDRVYASGPQMFLCKLYEIFDRVGLLDRLVLVVETYVRCGLGFCGKCIVPGTNKLLCRDGPAFLAQQLKNWFLKVCMQGEYD